MFLSLQLKLFIGIFLTCCLDRIKSAYSREIFVRQRILETSNTNPNNTLFITRFMAKPCLATSLPPIVIELCLLVMMADEKKTWISCFL